jgi:rhodanese-related sulfurtransferase
MRHVTAIPLGLLAACSLLAVGCGSDSDATIVTEVQSTAPAQTEGQNAPSPAASIIIDVRTPEEFAQGHLDGAINLDVEGGAFEAGLADLDPSATYAVYCRSGRRSALAADAMAQNGFTDVADLGSIEAAAAATGLPVATG